MGFWPDELDAHATHIRRIGRVARMETCVGKPANYLNYNMLVELDSLEELDIIDARGKVFSEFCNFCQLFLVLNCTEISHDTTVV